MPSPKNIAIAKFLRDVFHTTPEVRRVLNRDESKSLDVVIAKNVPEAGVVTYSTLGMSDVVFKHDDGQPYDFKMEIVASDDTGTGFIPDILFEVYNHALENPDWNCSPGSVLQNLIVHWKADTEMKHGYFTSSFFIEELGELQEIHGEHVIWVMLIPISQKELEYLQKHGDDAFETLLEEGAANILDYDRESLL